MRVVLAALTLALLGAAVDPVMADELLASLGVSDASLAMTPKPAAHIALVCFGAGEQVSGMNKICYYNCNGSAAAITISSVKLCPLTINR
jgi:hypothetical protein